MSGKQIMEYTETFNKFKSLFNSENNEIQIPDSEIKIHNTGFRSDLPLNEFMNEKDKLISENRSFSYPVFAPRRQKATR